MHLENIPLQWVILKGFERDPFPHLAHSLLSWVIRWKPFGSHRFILFKVLVNHGSSCSKVSTVIGQNVTKPQFRVPMNRFPFFVAGGGGEGGGGVRRSYDPKRFTENRPFLKLFHQVSKLIMFKFPLSTSSSSFPLLC